MKKLKPPKRGGLRRDVKSDEWLDIKYKGKTCVVAVASLLDAWIHEQNLKSLLQVKP